MVLFFLSYFGVTQWYFVLTEDFMTNFRDEFLQGIFATKFWYKFWDEFLRLLNDKLLL